MSRPFFLCRSYLPTQPLYAAARSSPGRAFCMLHQVGLQWIYAGEPVLSISHFLRFAAAFVNYCMTSCASKEYLLSHILQLMMYRFSWRRDRQNRYFAYRLGGGVSARPKPASVEEDDCCNDLGWIHSFPPCLPRRARLAGRNPIFMILVRVTQSYLFSI